MGCRNRFSLEGFCINHRCSKIRCIYGIHSSSATMDYEMLCDMTYVTYGMSSWNYWSMINMQSLQSILVLINMIMISYTRCLACAIRLGTNCEQLNRSKNDENSKMTFCPATKIKSYAQIKCYYMMHI